MLENSHHRERLVKDMVLTMPVVALRGMTILPGMIAHFDISRDKSLRAVEESMMDEQRIFLVTQKNVEQANPIKDDLYKIGIIANIKQVIKLQNNIVRILVEGLERAELLEFSNKEEYLEGEILELSKEDEENNEIDFDLI